MQARILAPDNTWVSATATYNYMMKDPLLDWLKHHHTSLSKRNTAYAPIIAESLQQQSSEYNFTTYIMNQGKAFEKKVMKLITKKFGAHRIANIYGETGARDPKKVQATLDAMKAGIPIIYSGVLHDVKRQTYGIPDLLVRSDWLNFLVRESAIPKELQNRAAPKLGRRYHYRVVDIKFTGLLLRADASRILNAASFPAYKAQLLIYNWALGELQGYTPQQVYILGRRWRSTSKGETRTYDACFDKLGIIDYAGTDEKYVAKTEHAVAWIKEVRTPEAAEWDIINYPLARSELYPNMCNTHDHPWRPVKERIAQESKELTSLWMVGPKNRDIAIASGVCQWTDPRCTPEVLGINGPITSRVLRDILDINQHSDVLIKPAYVKNNIGDWKTPDEVEFFVDFESCNGVVANIKFLPAARTSTVIFMIGVGYVDPKTHKWVYHRFVTHRMTYEEEERICGEFVDFITHTAQQYNVRTPRCFHWAAAENTMWADVVQRHGEVADSWRTWEWDWIDMLTIFKHEPIVIHGCMSFGLKSVAAAMKRHGFIKTSWNSELECVDGQSAMVAARKAHNEARKLGCSMAQIPVLRDIIEYNEVDVKVLEEILTYLRRYHADESIMKPRSQTRSPRCSRITPAKTSAKATAKTSTKASKATAKTSAKATPKRDASPVRKAKPATLKHMTDAKNAIPPSNKH